MTNVKSDHYGLKGCVSYFSMTVLLRNDLVQGEISHIGHTSFQTNPPSGYRTYSTHILYWAQLKASVDTQGSDPHYSDITLAPWCLKCRQLNLSRITDKIEFSITGARLTKAFDVTIQSYRNSHTQILDSKKQILRYMGSKFCAKFQLCPLKFHTKFWTHTPQNVHFRRC